MYPWNIYWCLLGISTWSPIVVSSSITDARFAYNQNVKIIFMYD